MLLQWLRKWRTDLNAKQRTDLDTLPGGAVISRQSVFHPDHPSQWTEESLREIAERTPDCACPSCIERNRKIDEELAMMNRFGTA